MQVTFTASPLGQALWSFLTQKHIVHALVVAVDLGAAPVSAISRDLLREFGNGSSAAEPLEQLEGGLAARFPAQAPIDVMTVKKVIGNMIRQILETLGHKVRSRKSKANDGANVFTSSARYE
jgi:hypothetical protein